MVCNCKFCNYPCCRMLSMLAAPNSNSLGQTPAAAANNEDLRRKFAAVGAIKRYLRKPDDYRARWWFEKRAAPAPAASLLHLLTHLLLLLLLVPVQTPLPSCQHLSDAVSRHVRFEMLTAAALASAACTHIPGQSDLLPGSAAEHGMIYCDAMMGKDVTLSIDRV